MATIRRSLHLISEIAAVAGLLMIAGCVGPAITTGPQQAAAPTQLGAGDRLRIIVFGQNQLSGDFFVADDGDISLPLVGRMHVAGMTAADAEQAIRRRLANGIVKEPVVNIDVVSYRPVYVVGEVARPGGYEPTGQMDVINAVALAGGYTYRARRDEVSVLRAGDPNSPVPVTDTTPVGPGDVVVVPERWF
jgi:polysaccharide export outer membrane protein